MSDTELGTVHWLGEGLLPPCPPPWALHTEGFTRLTPVLDQVTCQGCIDVLRHA